MYDVMALLALSGNSVRFLSFSSDASFGESSLRPLPCGRCIVLAGPLAQAPLWPSSSAMKRRKRVKSRHKFSRLTRVRDKNSKDRQTFIQSCHSQLYEKALKCTREILRLLGLRIVVHNTLTPAQCSLRPRKGGFPDVPQDSRSRWLDFGPLN